MKLLLRRPSILRKIWIAKAWEHKLTSSEMFTELLRNCFLHSETYPIATIPILTKLPLLNHSTCPIEFFNSVSSTTARQIQPNPMWVKLTPMVIFARLYSVNSTPAPLSQNYEEILNFGMTTKSSCVMFRKKCFRNQVNFLFGYTTVWLSQFYPRSFRQPCLRWLTARFVE